jgi:hypothetical protein
LGLEQAIICPYLRPDGREDVKKFFNILENWHSDNGPLVNIWLEDASALWKKTAVQASV